MKKLFTILFILIGLSVSVQLNSTILFSKTSPKYGWSEQIRSMIYLILHLSSINAINGMNLTKKQAVELKNMALEIEAVSRRIPDFNIEYRPDLAEVCDIFLEVRKYIIAGKEVPEELEKRVNWARGVEATVIRQSIKSGSKRDYSCISCHQEPYKQDLRSERDIQDTVNRISSSLFFNDRQVFFSHMIGIFRKKGMEKIKDFSQKVDRMLSDGQKEILRTFSCCLVPPKDLSDPVRAGQAAGGEKVIEILRVVRKVPSSRWPMIKARSLKKLETYIVFKYPGITNDKIKIVCDRVGAIYEKVRGLSEVEFEMEKGNLAVELKGSAEREYKLNRFQQSFMNALFLFVPGSAELYENIIIAY